VPGFGACRTLFDVSLNHFAVSLLSQLKHILGLADQRGHASTFERVRLCSEGKISSFAENKRVILPSRSFKIHILMYVYNNVKINGPLTLLRCSPIMKKYVMKRCFNSYTCVTILIINVSD